MSKSTLSICLNPEVHPVGRRSIEVPCRLPEAFNFRHGDWVFTANLCGDTVNGIAVSSVETEADDGVSSDHHNGALEAAESILATAKQNLGMGLVAPPQCLETLRAIALAYEAECAAHNAQFLALQVLPRNLQNPSLVSTHPSEKDQYAGGAVGMLAQYVAWVFEQACDAQTKRAEQAAKVAP